MNFSGYSPNYAAYAERYGPVAIGALTFLLLYWLQTHIVEGDIIRPDTSGLVQGILTLASLMLAFSSISLDVLSSSNSILAEQFKRGKHLKRFLRYIHEAIYLSIGIIAYCIFLLAFRVPDQWASSTVELLVAITIWGLGAIVRNHLIVHRFANS